VDTKSIRTTAATDARTTLTATGLPKRGAGRISLSITPSTLSSATTVDGLQLYAAGIDTVPHPNTVQYVNVEEIIGTELFPISCLAGPMRPVNPYKVDTDGDGIWDGWDPMSARCAE